MGSVDVAPAVLGGLDELEGHGEPGGSRSRPLGHLGAEPDGGEGRLDGFEVFRCSQCSAG